MPISLRLQSTDTELFCSSKWWGDPDLPAELPYPLVPLPDGEEPYPLTFVCQIDCEELAPFDPAGCLPHEGMFYVFAALDAYAGYESPIPTGAGLWPKEWVAVRYARSINFETFRSAVFLDEEDEPVTEPALKLSPTDAEAAGGLCLLPEDVLSDGLPEGEWRCFLRIPTGTAGLDFGAEGACLEILYRASDLQHGNWKRALACLHLPKQ